MLTDWVLGFWLHLCVLGNTLVGSKIVVSMCRIGTVLGEFFSYGHLSCVIFPVHTGVRVVETHATVTRSSILVWYRWQARVQTFSDDIMEKYYEMFRGKNQANKKDLFNSPDSPDHSDQDSDTDGWTRLRRSWGLNAEEWVPCERDTSLSFIKITQSIFC